MLLPRLISHYLKHGDDSQFYLLQAREAIDWLRKSQVPVSAGVRVLDLGCGHGVFGAELAKSGCSVTFSDEQNYLLPELAGHKFIQLDIDRQGIRSLGLYDLVICSNVYEHLARPDAFLADLHTVLAPGGFFYLSWTNWLSPWGGHEFSPFHYLGANLGQKIFDRTTGRKRKHTVGQNLYVTFIGSTLREIRKNTQIRILRKSPRYYTEFGPILSLPLVREFLAWNCALLLARK